MYNQFTDQRAATRQEAPMDDQWKAGLEDVTVADTNEVCSPTAECGTKAAITIFLAKGRKVM